MLKRIWEDFKYGENLDIYLTVIIATSIAVLSLFDVVSSSAMSSATLAVLALLSFVIIQRQSRTALKKSKEDIAQAEAKVEAQPEKAKPAWDLARATLEAYFNRNLSQITSIFWLSVVVMTVGFGILIWGLSQAIQSPNAILPAAIAGAAGVITEFIGATFLFVYRSTIQQAINYSKTLERINSVGMAMQILDTMPDKTSKDDLKSKTKATLVALLVSQASETTTAMDGKESEKSKAG